MDRKGGSVIAVSCLLRSQSKKKAVHKTKNIHYTQHKVLDTISEKSPQVKNQKLTSPIRDTYVSQDKNPAIEFLQQQGGLG